jgi:hypothetical protein
MAKPKPREDTRLRDALADTLRRGVRIAERFDGLHGDGRTTRADAARVRVEALESGEAVTVAGWKLGGALAEIGAPKDEVHALLWSAHAYTVERDGSYSPSHL